MGTRIYGGMTPYWIRGLFLDRCTEEGEETAFLKRRPVVHACIAFPSTWQTLQPACRCRHQPEGQMRRAAAVKVVPRIELPARFTSEVDVFVVTRTGQRRTDDGRKPVLGRHLATGSIHDVEMRPDPLGVR